MRLKSKKHPVIIFEGPNNTGKTLAAQRLAQEVGGRYMHSPPEAISHFRKHFKSLGPEALFEYFMVGNRMLEAMIQEQIDQAPLIIDRHYFSTIAAQSFVLGKELDYLIGEISVEPDRVYLLTADLDELEHRAEKEGELRQSQNARDIEDHSIGVYRRILQDFKTRELDTTSIDEEKVFRIVLEDYVRIKKEKR